MKKMKVMENDPDMLKEYDFRNGVRGKYAAAYREGSNIIVLDPELSDVFPDSDSVNQVLRPIAELIRTQRQIEPRTA